MIRTNLESTIIHTLDEVTSDFLIVIEQGSVPQHTFWTKDREFIVVVGKWNLREELVSR